MNIEREWRRAAPEFVGREFTLHDLVSDFIRRRTDPASPLMHNRDDVVDFCAQATDLRTAIQRAVDSRRPNGKIHNHQSRVKERARQRLGRWLFRDMPWLYKQGRVGTFENVHDRIVSYGLDGIGPVTAYDVATRVCAWLKLEPRFVHLHAGCLQGLRALMRSSACEHDISLEGLRVGEYVDPELLPPAIGRRLTPDEVEDFLCVYRAVLHRAVPAGL